MDWTTIKQELYFEDGSLRDIVVDADMALEKWVLICSFLYKNYRLSVFCDGDKIDDDFNYLLVKNMLSDDEHSYYVSFSVCEVQLHLYFWGSQYLEFDLFPNEVDSLEKHMAILDFMAQLSNLLSFTVKLTGESCHDTPLLEVEPVAL